jgi:protein involved in polysaccharide export with SLBB domain
LFLDGIIKISNFELNSIKMEIATQKKEIIDWILSIEDQAVLNEIEVIKKQTNFNFDEEFKKGLTVEQFRTAIKERIASYNWER